MPQLAGAGYGAAKALEQIIAERRMQQALEAEIRNREGMLAESQRSSQADEAYRNRSLDVQQQHYANEAAVRQREREETQGQQAFMNQQPGRVEEPVAAKIRLNPAFGAMLKTSQSLPEQEGVGPLQEPETQRPELWDERQNRVTNERLLGGQRLTQEERAADNAAQAARDAEQKRQFGITSAETSRYHGILAGAEQARREGPELGEVGPYRNIIDSIAINVAPGRRTPVVRGIQRRYQEAQDSGDPSELNRFIKQAAVEYEPVDDRRQITGRMDASAALKDIRAGLNELKAAGVDTNVLRGTVEDAARYLGTSTDPRLAAIGTRISDAFIQYRRSLTGVAFGEREGEEYRALFPNYYNELPVNEAILGGLERSMSTRDTAYWTRKFGQQGAALLGNQPTAETPPPAGGVGATPAAPKRMRFDAQGRPIK